MSNREAAEQTHKKVYRFLKMLSLSIIERSTRTKARASAVMLALLPTSSLMAIEMNMLKTVATTTAGTQIFSQRGRCRIANVRLFIRGTDCQAAP